MAWSLHTVPCSQTNETSFVGGQPRIPKELKLPVCQLCGQQQTFFFQVAMPESAPWAGYTVAVFGCTKCVNKDYLIPEMLPTVLRGAIVPRNFLIEYQKNFAFLVFRTNEAERVENYEERILFSAIKFKMSSAVGTFGKLGGTPKWVLEDESPSTTDSGSEFNFLLQVSQGYQFAIGVDAERQIKLNLMRQAVPSQWPYYQLFLSNAIYLFGAEDDKRLVYALTQV